MENLLTNLKTAIFKVMEQMFFLLPDEEAELSTGNVSLVPVYIGITGTPGYVVELAFDRGLAGRMTADLLGIDGNEADDELIAKSLRETANIIGGNFLLSLDDSGNRNVTLPSMAREELYNGGETENSDELVLSFEGGRVRVRLDRIATL